MIQRIQSVWLFLASVIIFALFMFPYLQYADSTGLGYALKVSGAYGNVDGLPTRLNAFWLQMIFTILVGLLPLYTIFLFGNRKKQINIAYVSILAIVLLGGWLYYSANSRLMEEGLSFATQYIGVGFFLLPISIIFLFMAIAGIRKDEKLIRSADRLR